MARVIDPRRVEGRRSSGYPKHLADAVSGRSKSELTAHLGLTQFGVNVTTLLPGAMSAHRHWHEKEDECCYVLEGEITLVSDEGEQVLLPGMAVGFPAGEANGHHLINRSDKPATYLEIGTRSSEERAHFPDVDMVAVKSGGKLQFLRKDGRPFE